MAKAIDWIVYKHTFPNGKIYIGITSLPPEKRWADGKGYQSKKNNKYCQPKMAYATLKYDWNDILHEILFEGLTKEEAEDVEQKLIAEYDSIKNGYNTENGGSVNKHTEESRKKLSENSPWNGRKHTEEELKKMSESQKGKRIGAENVRSKRVAQYNLQMHLIKVWDCTRDAERETGINHANISRCCNKTYQTSGGFIWRYYDEELEVD